MPIYMDRHDVSAEVTAENVAHLHQEDLKVQDEFNCRGLTYWFDDQRKTAFCLVEAPNADSVHRMHAHAHGEVPHSIIEVDANLVESFLGRIEDPKGLKGSELNVINEPGFRTLFAAKLFFDHLDQPQLSQLSSVAQEYKRQIGRLVASHSGNLVNQDSYEILASFAHVKDAVACAESALDTLGNEYSYLKCAIGLDAGNPVSNSKFMFEETIKTSKRLANLRSNISVSATVHKMYHDELADLTFNKQAFKLFSAAELVFLNQLSDHLDANYGEPELRIERVAKSLGFSKSQFYRSMVGLSGDSPNLYLNNFRLDKSLELLKGGMNTTSEAAFLCGFSSPSYFSRRFAKRYGVPPTEYIRAVDV
jgi:AraC-like DNA-binding protein